MTFSRLQATWMALYPSAVPSLARIKSEAREELESNKTHRSIAAKNLPQQKDFKWSGFASEFARWLVNFEKMFASCLAGPESDAVLFHSLLEAVSANKMAQSAVYYMGSYKPGLARLKRNYGNKNNVVDMILAGLGRLKAPRTQNEMKRNIQTFQYSLQQLEDVDRKSDLQSRAAFLRM